MVATSNSSGCGNQAQCGHPEKFRLIRSALFRPHSRIVPVYRWPFVGPGNVFRSSSCFVFRSSSLAFSVLLWSAVSQKAGVAAAPALRFRQVPYFPIEVNIADSGPVAVLFANPLTQRFPGLLPLGIQRRLHSAARGAATKLDPRRNQPPTKRTADSPPRTWNPEYSPLRTPMTPRESGINKPRMNTDKHG